MNSDYDDVDKLLSHIHLKDFTYNSFRRNESAPPQLRVVRSAEAAPAPAKTEAAPAVVAAAPRAVAPEQPVEQEPQQPAPASKAATVTPITPTAIVPKAVVATPKAPAAEPAATSRIGDALARLTRVGMVASAPKLKLHLELQPRPEVKLDSAPADDGDHSVGVIFKRLRGTAEKLAQGGTAETPATPAASTAARGER